MPVKPPSTIPDTIAAGMALKISHAKLHYRSKTVTDNVEVVSNSSGIIDEYYPLLLAAAREVTLTDDELNKYRYQPKLFSLDQFGTTELWALILRMNRLSS